MTARLNLRQADWLNEDARERLQQRERTRITKDGELVVTASRHRSQARNVTEAMAKLQQVHSAARFCSCTQCPPLRAQICDAAAEEPKTLSEKTRRRIDQLFVPTRLRLKKAKWIEREENEEKSREDAKEHRFCEK